ADAVALVGECSIPSCRTSRASLTGRTSWRSYPGRGHGKRGASCPHPGEAPGRPSRRKPTVVTITCWSILIRLQNPHSAYPPVHGTTRLDCEGPPPPWRTQSRCAVSCERDSLYLEG